MEINFANLFLMISIGLCFVCWAYTNFSHRYRMGRALRQLEHSLYGRNRHETF